MKKTQSNYYLGEKSTRCVESSCTYLQLFLFLVGTLMIFWMYYGKDGVNTLNNNLKMKEEQLNVCYEINKSASDALLVSYQIGNKTTDLLKSQFETIVELHKEISKLKAVINSVNTEKLSSLPNEELVEAEDDEIKMLLQGPDSLLPKISRSVNVVMKRSNYDPHG